MTDVRCPMCGKTNPADAETCRYCGARLKPLTNSSGPAAPGQSTTPPSQKNDADWLGSLRRQQDVPPVPPNKGVFVPGPLSKNSSGKSEPEESAGVPDEDFSSWLSRIGAEDAPGETGGASIEQSSSPRATGETDDWLSSLRDIPTGRETEKGDSYSAGLAGQASQDDSSWMNRLEPANEESPADSGYNFSIPEEPAAPADEDLPSWLRELSGNANPAQTQTPAVSPAPPETPLPDWFDNLVTAQPASADQPVQSEQPSIESPEAAEIPGWESQEPDWFSGLGSTQPADESPTETENAKPWDGPLPDWLSAAKPSAGPGSPEPGGSDQIPSSYAEATKPDLKKGYKPEEGVGTPHLSDSDLGSITPDWVSNPASDTGNPSGPNPAEELAWSTDLPDWLSGIAAVEPSAQVSEETSNPSLYAASDSQDSDTGSPAIKSELPNWMNNLGPQTTPEPDDGSQTPALLYDESPIVGEQAEVRPFISEEMPDWLVHLGPPEVISSVTPPSGSGAKNPPPVHPARKGEDDSGIAPADLPSWVQAMRPIETATPSVSASSETDDRVENSGPLAGVRGILPSEPLLAEIRKPAAYSVKLQVSEKQRANAALLQTLLSVETEPQKISRTRPFPSQRIFRLVVALVMIVAVWAPIWIGGPLTPLPAFSASGISAVRASIGSIPVNSPVLVAVEYEPGLSGELETISAGVVAQLMARSANIVFVSTNPAGPVLTQNLLDRALVQQPAYAAADKVANLGYLAGGPAALYDFSLADQNLDPLKTGQPDAWNNPPLNSVKTLADFSRVFVLTDNADTARAWVEQVKPALGQTPLFMVISAQSVPMISPYLDSGQISGIISGLSDGATFEQATGQSISIRKFWDSYQAGLIIIIVLILIGGLLSIWNMMRANRRPRGEA